MLAIDVEFLHGTVRAGSADDTVLAGEIDHGDWPPSPARVLSAFAAGGGTRDRIVAGDGSELLALEAAAPPRIHAVGRSRVLESPQRERYVVLDRRKNGTVHEYPARTSRMVRPGTRLAPSIPRVVYEWPNLDLRADQVAALQARAARIGYLGCADSPVRVRVLLSLDDASAPEEVWEPGASSHAIPVPYTGYVEGLDAAFDLWRAGQPVRRAWLRTERSWYRSPDDPPAMIRPPGPTILVLRFERALPGRSVLRVTTALKAAVLAAFSEQVGGDAPAVLHGHGFTAVGYQLAHYVALADVGHAHARGRIHGAAVVLPADCSGATLDGVRSALAQIRLLYGPGFSVPVRPWAGDERPVAARPDRWIGPARRWGSVFPVVHERRSKQGLELSEVTRWCEHVGLPAPSAFRSSAVPILPGAVALRPHEVFLPDAERRPYSHIVLEFPREVRGPVVLGRARQLGLGLFAPLPPEAAL